MFNRQRYHPDTCPRTEKIFRDRINTNENHDVWFEYKKSCDRRQNPLPLFLEVCNHSPSGFYWGYGGSGPAQLALAILMETFNDRQIAEKHYQEFKGAFIGSFESEWSISETAVRRFVQIQNRS